MGTLMDAPDLMELERLLDAADDCISKGRSLDWEMLRVQTSVRAIAQLVYTKRAKLEFGHRDIDFAPECSLKARLHAAEKADAVLR